MPTPRGTLRLIAVLGACVAYLFFTRGGVRVAPLPPPDDIPPLLSRAPGDIARIEVGGPGRSLAVVRTAGGWTDPNAVPWPSEAPGTLLEALRSLRPLFVVDPQPQRPEDFGLGPQADRLRLLTPDGSAVLDLEIGARNPSWTGVYVRAAGRSEVLLVGSVLRWELAKLGETAPVPMTR
ncbi:MAG: DUF4340 domain-containing protein [Candidatus Binatia bacterium]